MRKIIFKKYMIFLITVEKVYDISYYRDQSLKVCRELIDFQTDVLVDVGKDADYGYDLNNRYLFHVWEAHKMEDITTYRDHPFTSKYTGTKSPIHLTPFMKAMDDSLECFMNGSSETSVNGS